MKIFFNFIKEFTLFVFTFLVVFFLFISSAIYYTLNAKDDSNTAIKSFYLVNASNEVFNVKIHANDFLILDETLEASSTSCFEWELDGSTNYEIQCTIGKTPQEKIYRYDYNHGKNYYYIIANSRNEFVFEAIRFKMEDF